MFGYVKAYRPYMRVCELDFYKGVYCGLCKKLTEQYGFSAALPLSYDFVFLTILQLGLNDTKPISQKKRCPVHPIRKTLCISCKDLSSNEFEYSSDAEVILTYHKLCDDLRDHGLKSKLRAAFMLPVMRKSYKQAAAKHKSLTASIQNAMKEQRKIERAKYRSLDRAAEPTATMMKAIFREIGGCDPDKRDLLGQFGYLLGRYVYICDALDDIEDDYKNNNYNPLLTKKMLSQIGKCDKLPKYCLIKASTLAEQSLNLTLGRLADIYTEISFNQMQPITDNIIYLGLKNTFFEIKKKLLDEDQDKIKKSYTDKICERERNDRSL